MFALRSKGLIDTIISVEHNGNREKVAILKRHLVDKVRFPTCATNSTYTRTKFFEMATSPSPMAASVIDQPACFLHIKPERP